MNPIVSFFLARWLKNRTAVGAALIVVPQVLDALMGEQVCGTVPALCALAGKASAVLAPWLVIAGIRDKDRK